MILRTSFIQHPVLLTAPSTGGILIKNAAGTIPAERHMAGATERKRGPRGSRFIVLIMFTVHG